MRRSFQRSNALLKFFKILSTKYVACSKPPSRDNHDEASYPMEQQRD